MLWVACVCLEQAPAIADGNTSDMGATGGGGGSLSEAEGDDVGLRVNQGIKRSTTSKMTIKKSGQPLKAAQGMNLPLFF